MNELETLMRDVLAERAEAGGRDNLVGPDHPDHPDHSDHPDRIQQVHHRARAMRRHRRLTTVTACLALVGAASVLLGSGALRGTSLPTARPPDPDRLAVPLVGAEPAGWTNSGGGQDDATVWVGEPDSRPFLLRLRCAESGLRVSVGEGASSESLTCRDRREGAYEETVELSRARGAALFEHQWATVDADRSGVWRLDVFRIGLSGDGTNGFYRSVLDGRDHPLGGAVIYRAASPRGLAVGVECLGQVRLRILVGGVGREYNCRAEQPMVAGKSGQDVPAGLVQDEFSPVQDLAEGERVPVEVTVLEAETDQWRVMIAG